jgi:serine-type D-Ala-D-Ala endopeptidase (penicillin-binding protein 7)
MKTRLFSPLKMTQGLVRGTTASLAVSMLLAAAVALPAEAWADTNAPQAAAVKKKLKKPVHHAALKVEHGVRPHKRATYVMDGHRRLRTVAFRPHASPADQAFGMQDSAGDSSLALRSNVAYVVDQNSSEPLLDKNSQAVVPIASISKLMTAMVTLDSKQSLEDQITVTDEDRDYEKGTGSRLSVGSVLSRRDMLHIALMASENRAAAALSRYYPGGRPAFIAAMNAKAKALGMNDTHFENSTGLSSQNVSSARDLVKMVNAAYQYPLIREFSTDRTYTVDTGKRDIVYNSTNALVRNGSWDIGLQKTGFINEAGECLVMQAVIHSRPIVMVLLDSLGKYSRFADAVRVRNWLDNGGGERLTQVDVPANGT